MYFSHSSHSEVSNVRFLSTQHARIPLQLKSCLPNLTKFGASLRSSGVLRSIKWSFCTVVSGQRSGPIFNDQVQEFEFLTLGDGTDRLSRNVGTELSFYAA
jgi:hypothetical protein